MKRPYTFAVLILWLGTLSASANTQSSIFDQWMDSGAKAVEFHVNFDSLTANRRTLNEIQGTMIDGDVSYPLKATVRGRFRRVNCEIPPLKIHFDKDVLAEQGFNKHNDYKLVTHCLDGEAGQEALLREQLAYELYREIKPRASFRTVLLKVTYVNKADDSRLESYAILIEDIDQLKDRISADNCKNCLNAPLDSYQNAEEFSLFQYMIGNDDFSTQMVRNMKVMQDEAGKLIAIPYDFDYSGLVSPSYAVLHDDRQFKWEFAANPNLDDAITRLIALEATLLAEVEEFDHLSKRSRKGITRYLKQFFRELKSGEFG